MRLPLGRNSALSLHGLLALGLAVAIFSLTYSNGGFVDQQGALVGALSTAPSYAAIAIWWVLGVGAALGIGAAWSRVGRLAIAAPALLALFAVWTLISISWAEDEGRAFAQFNEVSLYVAVLLLGIVLARVVPASFLVGAVALALSAVAVVALVSRFFPSSFGSQPGYAILSPLHTRLSFPLGYWNGLGIDVALAYPLLLATMAARRSRVASALAALPLPALAAVMYMTSSRGAFVAAAIAVVAYVLLAPNRWTALVGVVVAAGAGAFSVAILVPRHELVNGEMAKPLAVHQGHHAALVIAIACVVTAVVWLGLAELGRRIPSPPSVVGWGTAGLLFVAAVAAIVAAHPIAKFDAFKRPPSVSGSGTYVSQHLLSTSGTWRWQLWSSAVSQFRTHPLHGAGAGAWQSWWQQHQTISLPSEYAHSLYLEALAELGIVGLVLIGAAVLVAVIGAVLASLKLHSGEVAAAAACGIAFFAAAAYDWIWPLAGITVVGLGMLGVSLGALPSTRARMWRRFDVVRPLLAVVAVAAILPQVVMLASEIHLRNSHTAALNGNGPRARSEALAAKAVEPWAASGYLQLAEIAKAEDRFAEARRWLDQALNRSNDYRLWIAAVQIDTGRGRIALARRDYAEISRLYPRSTYLHETVAP